jgi:hypothetical protein
LTHGLNINGHAPVIASIRDLIRGGVRLAMATRQN